MIQDLRNLEKLLERTGVSVSVTIGIPQGDLEKVKRRAKRIGVELVELEDSDFIGFPEFQHEMEVEINPGR